MDVSLPRHFSLRVSSKRVALGGAIACSFGARIVRWIVAFYGCLLRGAVVVPLDLKSAPDFAGRVQQQVSAKLLLADESQLNVPCLSLNNLADAIAHHPSHSYDATPNDLVQVVFTSGTTAEPKGVCLTHRNLLTNIAPIEKEFRKYARWERLVHPLRFLCLLPLSHVFGQMMSIFIPELIGAEVYFRESYKPSEIITVVKKQRINVVVTVPRVLETLREKLINDERLSDVQLATPKAVTFCETGGPSETFIVASAGASGLSSPVARLWKATRRVSGAVSAMQSFKATA